VPSVRLSGRRTAKPSGHCIADGLAFSPRMGWQNQPMTMEKFLALALITGVAAPLFWLGVNIAEGKVKRLLREKIAQRQARRSAAKLCSPARIGK
jgi:hypothetical protein